MTRQPTIAELDELGRYLQTVTPPEFEDLNGHVNVTGHYQLFNRGLEAMWQSELGLDVARAQTGEGSFALSQHLRFHREILVGEEVSLHVRVFARSAKVFHTMAILANRTTGVVASTCETIDAFVDLRARKVTEMPEDLAAALDRLIEAQRDLPWQLPMSETLEVRA